jgi:hypothetical protein
MRPSASAHKIRACEPNTCVLYPLNIILHLLLNFNRAVFAISSSTGRQIHLFCKSSGFPEAQTQRKGPNHNQNTWTHDVERRVFEIDMISRHYIRSCASNGSISIIK